MEKYKKLKDSDFIDFEYRTYKDGIETLNLSSWNEFIRAVKKFNYYPAYIWRGQRKEWTLKSSFDRGYFNDGLVSLFANRERILNALLKKFKEKLIDLPQDMRKNDDDKIWAIGQHYNLPTPLLDWTKNPYKAAYFAFYVNGNNEQKNRVIYALNMAVKRRKKGTKRFVEFPDLAETCDDRQNKRLQSQEGKFTKSLNGIDIETNVLNYARRCEDDIITNKKILLAKILIPNTIRDTCLKFLEVMEDKITHGTLFPDYAGAVEICKIDLDLEN
jgi:hypothetical protein